MKFDIIIPCWNTGDLLCRALQSVLDQTHKDYEVYVIDGSPNEGDKEYFDKTVNDDDRFHYMVQDKDKHPYAAGARNQGVAAGNSTHIAFLDSDDRWYKEHLGLHDLEWSFEDNSSLIWSGLEADIGLESAFTGKEVIMRHRACFYTYELPKLPKDSRWMWGAYLFGLVMVPTNITVSRTAFEGINGFPILRYHEDKLMQTRIIHANPNVRCIEEITCYADWHREGKVSGTLFGQVNTAPAECQELFEEHSNLSADMLKPYAQEFLDTHGETFHLSTHNPLWNDISRLCKRVVEGN